MIVYKGKIFLERDLKKIKDKEKKEKEKKQLELDKLYRRKMYFIGKKPNFRLWEGNIIEIKNNSYKVKVKNVKTKERKEFEIEQKRVHFD